VPQDAVPFGVELSKLLTWMRALAARMSADGADWRSAVDAVRPHTRRLWRSMSEEQKRRFLRHAHVYWDAHRPRMVPEVERNTVGLRSSGHLTIIAGRVLSPFNGPRRPCAYRRRGTNAIEDHCFARIIDCTGQPEDPIRSENPLIRALLARRAARAEPLRVGLDVAEDYALIERERTSLAAYPGRRPSDPRRILGMYRDPGHQAAMPGHRRTTGGGGSRGSLSLLTQSAAVVRGCDRQSFRIQPPLGCAASAG
jgi:uncharacterized NAD(P)/FAD-binding protein YdhS